jgi:hypothetical protein
MHWPLFGRFETFGEPLYITPSTACCVVHGYRHLKEKSRTPLKGGPTRRVLRQSFLDETECVLGAKACGEDFVDDVVNFHDGLGRTFFRLRVE